MYNGVKLEGAYLVVKKAMFQRKFSLGRSSVPEQNNSQRFVIRGKVWKRRMEPEMHKEPDRNEGNTNVVYNVDPDEKDWMDRCAYAILPDIKSIETVREELRVWGLSSCRVKLLGAREVLLEFDSKDEREFYLTEAATALCEIFELVQPSSCFMTAKSFLVWIRVWKVPLGAWNFRFFSALGNLLGKYVCMDTITASKQRMDFARVLVETSYPLIAQQYMDCNVEGTVCRVLLEKEVATYHDWSGLSLNPEAKKHLGSESGDDDDRVESGVLGEQTADAFDTAAASARGGVDLSEQALQDLIDDGYNPGELMALKGNQDGSDFVPQVEKSLVLFQEGEEFQENIKDTLPETDVSKMQGKISGMGVRF